MCGDYLAQLREEERIGAGGLTGYNWDPPGLFF